VWFVARRTAPPVAALALRAALAGAVATLALEAIRYPGFRLGTMPGNLPQLMGVLLLDRFALGLSTLSDAAGFAYHFWNGANFGIVFAMLAMGRSRWLAVPFGIAIGNGFMASRPIHSIVPHSGGTEATSQYTLIASRAVVSICINCSQRSRPRTGCVSNRASQPG